MINTNSLVDSYALLTRSLCLKNIQLACVKLFASVHSEPGSNSFIQTIHDLLKKKKGVYPATGSPTATLLRLHYNHRQHCENVFKTRVFNWKVCKIDLIV